MSRSALVTLVLDPGGAARDAASDLASALGEPVAAVRTVEEALAWRRQEGVPAVLVASRELMPEARRALSGGIEPVEVDADALPTPRAGDTLFGASHALALAVERALGVARARRQARRWAAVERRRQRQLAMLRSSLLRAGARIRGLAAANVRLQEMTTGLVRLVAVVGEHVDEGAATRAERTARVAVALARRLDIPVADQADIRAAAMLHHVGRLADANDDGATDHSERGARLLESLPLPAAVIEAVRLHHERHDGCGNASGLAGHDLPRAARILAVASAFVDLVAGPGADGATACDQAASVLRATAGRVHDPEIVAALCRLLRDENELSRLGLATLPLAGATR